MGAPPREHLRQPTPELTPHPTKMSPVPPSDNQGAHASEIEVVPLGYVYIHTPLPSPQCFKLDAYAKDCKRDKDFNPDSLTDEGTSTA